MKDFLSAVKPYLTPRLLFLYGFLSCLVLMVIALYFQHVMNLEPCPLCVFQRVTVIIMGAICLLGAVHNPEAVGQRIYGVLMSICAVIGAGLAARHVWLQHLPEDQIPDCGPGLAYMMDAFPLLETLEMVLSGSGECAEVVWTFLGLSIPEWTLIIFIGFIVLSVYFIFSGLKRNSKE